MRITAFNSKANLGNEKSYLASVLAAPLMIEPLEKSENAVQTK